MLGGPSVVFHNGDMGIQLTKNVMCMDCIVYVVMGTTGSENVPIVPCLQAQAFGL